MAIQYYVGDKITGLSTDTKPVATVGSTFLELDTGNGFYYYGGTWNPSPYITNITNENIDDLADVLIATPVNDQVLFYENGDWVNRAITEADISDLGTYDNYNGWGLQANSGTIFEINSGKEANFTGSGATSVSRSGNTITISSTDTNTDTNYYLSGLSFNDGSGILTATVSGATNQTVDLSGIDADSVDGYHASAFARIASTTANDNVLMANRNSSTNAVLYVNNYGGGPLARFTAGTALGDTTPITFQINNDGSITSSIGTYWNSSNDGPGSGLNADRLDGDHASAFLKDDSGLNTLGNYISTSGDRVEAGRGSGSVAMTINDGRGHANLCFNHNHGVPDSTGSSGRIECAVDSSQARMDFELSDSTTSGVATSLTLVMQLSQGGVWVPGSLDAALLTQGGHVVLTTDDEGPGGGIDADTVDGQHAAAFLGVNDTASDSNLLDGLNSTQFLRSDTTDFKTSGYTRYNDNIRIDFGSGHDFRVWHNGTNHLFYSYNGTADFVFRTYDGSTYRYIRFNTDGTATALDWEATSDIKFKENIRPLSNTLDNVLKLRGVRYNRTDDEDKKERIGVIAQEIEKIYPEFVSTRIDSETEESYKTVNYPKLTTVLIEAIKEQNEKLNILEDKINKILEEK
jgi:hypothetical protein